MLAVVVSWGVQMLFGTYFWCAFVPSFATLALILVGPVVVRREVTTSSLPSATDIHGAVETPAHVISSAQQSKRHQRIASVLVSGVLLGSTFFLAMALAVLTHLSSRHGFQGALGLLLNPTVLPDVALGAGGCVIAGVLVAAAFQALLRRQN